MAIAVADACFLITLGAANALGLLQDLPGWTFVTCRRAVTEVQRPPASLVLEEAIRHGWMNVVEIDLDNDQESAALAGFDARPAFRNRADAEVLALAQCRGWVVATDDRAVRRAAARLGPDCVIGCVELLALAVHAGRITTRRAEMIVKRLDTDLTNSDLRSLL